MDTLARVLNELLTPVSRNSWLIANLSFWTWSLVYFVMDSIPRSTRLGEFLQSPPMRIQPKQATLTKVQYWEVFRVALFNMTVIAGLCGYAFDYFWYIPMKDSIPSATDPYLWYRELLCFMGCVLLVDTVFYWTHRTLHASPFLYTHIHKIHHRWTAPCGMAAVYAHPVEHAFSNILSVAIGPALTMAHPKTTYFWYAFALFSTCKNHSGYQLLEQARVHDAHHECFRGNYGTGPGFMDVLWGTSISKKDLERKRSKE